MIWKYLSYSNLLENIDSIDLEDKEKLLAIEMATHENNYKEDELFALYERFKFNINQLLTVEESYKLLPSSESRALVYQGILITKETSEKIKLIKLLKDLFIKDEVSEAFNYKLVEFLDGIDETEIPSDYTVFYDSYKKVSISKNKKIKFNNKIIHQSKILDHFKEESNLKNVEKDLENLLKKIKKDKKYFFSTKDIIMLESLKSDGIKLPKKYENIYEVKDPNIPYDIQILINKEESGLALLRLVQIIGEDKAGYLPPLEGDKCTFIGSTFRYAGEADEYFNHMIALNTCDNMTEVDNSKVESKDTEAKVLLAWKDLIQREDPDIIIGYNIFGFDWAVYDSNVTSELKMSNTNFVNYRRKETDFDCKIS